MKFNQLVGGLTILCGGILLLRQLFGTSLTDSHNLHLVSAESSPELSIEELYKLKSNLLVNLAAVENQIAVFNTRQYAPKLVDSNKVEVGRQQSNQLCPYNFSVYVYEIPLELASVRFSEEARHNKTLHVCQKCILEQFALEYIVYDFFSQFCGRTWDPEIADYFYLPIVRDAEFRLTMEAKGPKSRAPSATEVALLDILEKNDSTKWKSVLNITDKYWHRHKGADHVLVMPAPVTNLRHESSKRGFFHYMIHLTPPIFIGVEYSLGFVREYPVCSTVKNIVVPYPTTDPDLFNGKLHGGSIPRNALLYYAGGMHGDCVEVRRAMKQLLANSSRLSGVLPDIKSVQAEREHGFRAATFCPIPIGDSPSSKRMYDVMYFGCIPVVLSDDLVWAYSDQTGGRLNHSLFSLQLPQAIVQFPVQRLLRLYEGTRELLGRLPASGLLIYDILQESQAEDEEYVGAVLVNPLVRLLRRIPAADVALYQRNVAEASSHFQFYTYNTTMTSIPTGGHVFPSGGATHMMAQLLTLRLSRGIDTIHSACAIEKAKKHKYISRYHCDTAR